MESIQTPQVFDAAQNQCVCSVAHFNRAQFSLNASSDSRQVVACAIRYTGETGSVLIPRPMLPMAPLLAA